MFDVLLSKDDWVIMMEQSWVYFKYYKISLDIINLKVINVLFYDLIKIKRYKSIPTNHNNHRTKNDFELNFSSTKIQAHIITLKNLFNVKSKKAWDIWYRDDMGWDIPYARNMLFVVIILYGAFIWWLIEKLFVNAIYRVCCRLNNCSNVDWNTCSKA